MSGGFEAIPGELRRTASSIGEAVGDALGIEWRGPSGDWGHAELQSAFANLIGDSARHAQQLAEAAGGFARGLEDSATAYEDSDKAAAESLGRLIGGLGAAGHGSGRMPDPPPFVPDGVDIGASVGNYPGGGAGAGPSELSKKLNPNAAEGR
jgi:hypothetical protein